MNHTQEKGLGMKTGDSYAHTYMTGFCLLPSPILGLRVITLCQTHQYPFHTFLFSPLPAQALTPPLQCQHLHD